MHFKSLASSICLAASLGLSAPAANAITVSGNISDPFLNNTVADNGPYDALGGPFNWNADFTSSDDAGMAVFQFQNMTAGIVELFFSVLTINQLTIAGTQIHYFVDGVKSSFLGDAVHHTPQGDFDSFGLSKLLNPGDIVTLVVEYGDPFGGTDGLGNPTGPDIDISAVGRAVVPVPAALPLLASGLLGLGYLARRRKSKAAA